MYKKCSIAWVQHAGSQQGTESWCMLLTGDIHTCTSWLFCTTCLCSDVSCVYTLIIMDSLAKTISLLLIMFLFNTENLTSWIWRKSNLGRIISSVIMQCLLSLELLLHSYHVYTLLICCWFSPANASGDWSALYLWTWQPICVEIVKGENILNGIWTKDLLEKAYLPIYLSLQYEHVLLPVQ